MRWSQNLNQTWADGQPLKRGLALEIQMLNVCSYQHLRGGRGDRVVTGDNFANVGINTEVEEYGEKSCGIVKSGAI